MNPLFAHLHFGHFHFIPGDGFIFCFCALAFLAVLASLIISRKEPPK